MNSLNTMQLLAVGALPLLFAITVHEVAHGWVAKKLGDPTAMMLGRLTLNPIKHIDPIGTILLPALLLMAGGFIFGWAKPVPVTWENLRNQKRDIALVALAGPGANLLMALGWGLIAKLGFVLGIDMLWVARPLIAMGQLGVMFNLILMVLNLLPIPPLDGSRVVSSLLPGRWSYQYNRLESFGLIIIVALLVTGIFGQIVGPPVFFLQRLIFALFGL